MKALDLSVFDKETMPIKLLDGTTIHVIKPTQKIAIEVSKLQGIDKDNAELVMKTLNTLVYMILNTNEEGYKTEMETIEDMGVGLKSKIVVAYTQWLNELISNPI